jgi:hypothetical protein
MRPEEAFVEAVVEPLVARYTDGKVLMAIEGEDV